MEKELNNRILRIKIHRTNQQTVLKPLCKTSLTKIKVNQHKRLNSKNQFMRKPHPKEKEFLW